METVGFSGCLGGEGLEKAFLAARRMVVVKVRARGRRGIDWRGAWLRPLRPIRESGARRDWQRSMALLVKQDIW